MEDEIFKIDDDLYADNEELNFIIDQSKNFNDEFVDKVVRIIIKGQIDGN